MRKLIINHLKLVIASVSVVALAAAGAFAYFSASGSGTGTATVGSASTLTLHGTTSGSLYPGNSTTVTFTADNSNAGKVYLSTISLSSVVACNEAFVSGSCPSGHEVTTCESVDPGSASDADASDFYMANVTVNTEIPAGTGESITPTGTLTMNDLASNQNSCENDYLQLNLTST